jgi:hypothetical protein
VVPEVADVAELTVFDTELDELEDGVVDVDVSVGFWLVVEGDGRGVLVVRGVVEGGIEEVEVAVLYQQNMRSNVKRNTHNGRSKTVARAVVELLPTGGAGTAASGTFPWRATSMR